MSTFNRFKDALASIPVIDGTLSPSNSNFWWERIEIPEKDRKKGKAGKACAKMIEYADEFGVTIRCFAVPDQGSRSKFAKKWVQFVRSYGFEVDVERLIEYTGDTEEEIRANDIKYGGHRDELIRFPKKKA